MTTFADIAAAVSAASRVVVIGLPASGKTTLANRLAETGMGHEVVHTDEEYPYAEGVSAQAYEDLLFAADMDCDVIVEGVLGYRVLRKCAENGGTWLPDLIIEVRCSEETRAARYAEERPGKQYRSVAAFCKGLEVYWKTWAESEYSKNVRHMVFVTD